MSRPFSVISINARPFDQGLKQGLQERDLAMWVSAVGWASAVVGSGSIADL
jgi:hypothetical protein